MQPRKLIFALPLKITILGATGALILAGAAAASVYRGAVPLGRKILEIHSLVKSCSTDDLRTKFHYRYRTQKALITFLKKNTPQDSYILFVARGMPPWFLPYYTSPRKFAFYSAALCSALKDRGQRNLFLLESWLSAEGKVLWELQAVDKKDAPCGLPQRGL